MAASATKDVNAYLAEKQAHEKDKELSEQWAQLEELYTKKLWHQLTLKLEEFVKHPSLKTGTNLIELYTNFICVFENKINPLSLVEISGDIVHQYTENQDAINFLTATEEKVKNHSEAVSLCKVLKGQILLQKMNDATAAKKIIEEVEEILNDTDGITDVHGRYYLLASNLYRLQGEHAEYYRTALRYLGCVELSTLSKEDQEHQAFFLGLAALLGDGVYNLGELLAHPILQSLKNTDKSWLVDLLHAFNSGDISTFEKMKPQWTLVMDLKLQENKILQKIRLLCLMEMTFQRSATAREMTFEEIAKETQLPLNDVELLVMKALAQGLVKGAIDQVASTVHMTWVQPRVLDKPQIYNMIERLETWCKDVDSMEVLLETKAAEFLTL